MNQNSNFIRKIYLASLFPNVIAVLGGTINALFDGILVGQRLGETGLAAVSQSLPVFLALCTIGSLFSSGGSFLTSIALGENKKAEGQRLFKATLLTSTVVGLLFCGIALVFAAPLCNVLSTPDTYDYVYTYVRITLIGGIFKVLLYVPFFYLRLEGKNRRSASAMLTMTALNVVMDYLFLFVFDFGIAGAAWASVAATAVACVMSFFFLFTDHSNFPFGLALYDMSDWKRTVKFGSPMALNNILSSLRVLILNLILGSMGGHMVAVFAVANNISEFSMCIQNGVPQTASAMTGIFFGEKDSAAVKKLLNVQLVTGFVVSAVFSLILCVFSGKIGLLFGSEADCSKAVICFAVSLLIATANNTISYFYNATGRISLADTVTVCRIFVMTTLFCAVFRTMGESVWLFFPLAELTTLVVVLVIGIVIAKKDDLSQFYLLDEHFERSGQSVSFSVECSDEKICEASVNIREFCEQNEFSSKKTMAISLSIEEILTIISQKSLMGEGSMDVRVLKSGDAGIVRVRSMGQRYNPIEENNGDLDYMGVQMISKIATKIEYSSSLGVNTLVIFL